MDFKKTIKAINKFQHVTIKHISFNSIIQGNPYVSSVLFDGVCERIPQGLFEEKWIVHEVRLNDVTNYNSGYIVTVY